jgi:hypothetical protein
MRQLDLPVADFASGEITPASYADAIIAGRGEGDGPEALALRQYGATNGPAIEAEFSRRADEATRAGPGNMTPIVPRRSAATIEEARAAASEFVGQPIMHPETGVTATMTKNSLKKVTHEKAISASDTVANHSLAIANADDLYRSSRHLFDHADPRGEPTLRIGRGSSYVKTQDGVRGVKITTKETAHAGNPNTLYTVQTMPLDPVVEVPRWTGEVEPGLLPTDRSVSVLGKPARTRFFLGRSSESPLTPADTSDNDIARLAGVMRNAAATASGTQDGSRNGGRSAAGTALNPGSDQDRSPPDPGAAGAAERARAQRVAEGLRRDAARRGTPALAAAWQRQQLKQKRLQQHRRSN